jgi:hypothetical protein
MRPWFALTLLFAAWLDSLPAADRINHAGRLLGPTPVVTNAILFNTPEADAIIAGLQIFPRDHPWNENISRRPRLPNSDTMIAQIFSELFAVGTNSPKLRAFQEMNFVLVPDAQPLIPIQFTVYGDESDPGPYPIPPNLPIEGWPSATGAQTLTQVQQDALHRGGDRHAILIQPGTGWIWETWQTLWATNPTAHWQSANGARFNLTNNALRPPGWTSADAAGLSMLGGLVRFDECQRGEVEHALRMIVKHTRREYIYPATHFASSPSTTNTNVPAMGQRLRLQTGFVVPANWTKEEKAIAAALKNYGGLIADNSSSFFSISVVPDLRWPSGAFNHLSALSVTNFEVIQTTGPNEGPRLPGAPRADAGPDRTVPRSVPVLLQGSVQYTNSAPLMVKWKMYSGPGTVTFGDPSRTNTTASFDTPGVYTLMLSADDGIHTPAYDAVVMTLRDGIHLDLRRDGTNLAVSWTGGSPPFQLDRAPFLSATEWQPLLTLNTNFVRLFPTSAAALFRVRGN